MLDCAASVISGYPRASSSATEIIAQMCSMAGGCDASINPALTCPECGSKPAPPASATFAKVSDWACLEFKKSDAARDGPQQQQQQQQQDSAHDVLYLFSRSTFAPSLLYEIALDELRTNVALDVREAAIAQQELAWSPDSDDAEAASA